MKTYSDSGHVNVGAEFDLTILELTRLVCDVVGFEGTIVHDYTKPDGTPRKLVNIDKIRALGWAPRIDLRSGVASTYEWFLRKGGSDGVRREAGAIADA
jgi:GDP-L-fucose synthase